MNIVNLRTSLPLFCVLTAVRSGSGNLLPCLLQYDDILEEIGAHLDLPKGPMNSARTLTIVLMIYGP